jgi:hypothetical protein
MSKLEQQFVEQLSSDIQEVYEAGINFGSEAAFRNVAELAPCINRGLEAGTKVCKTVMGLIEANVSLQQRLTEAQNELAMIKGSQS